MAILAERVATKGCVIVSSLHPCEIGAILPMALRNEDVRFPVRVTRETTYEAWLGSLPADAPGRLEPRPPNARYYEIEALD